MASLALKNLLHDRVIELDPKSELKLGLRVNVFILGPDSDRLIWK